MSFLREVDVVVAAEEVVEAAAATEEVGVAAAAVEEVAEAAVGVEEAAVVACFIKLFHYVLDVILYQSFDMSSYALIADKEN